METGLMHQEKKMSNEKKLFLLEEYKIKASILMKELRSKNDAIAKKAVDRFTWLLIFKDHNLAELLAAAKRKHALNIIAIEQGYASWVELKKELEPPIGETFVESYKGGFLNKWFVSYESAKIEQHASDGFLLPYKKQFFVCEESYIKVLGMDPSDPDWHAIDRDWVKPASQKAFHRLNKKWLQIKEKK